MCPLNSAEMKVRAVLFDLDETLIEEESTNDASALAACEIAFARHGVDRANLLAALRKRSAERWLSGPMLEYCRDIGISSREGLWGSFIGADADVSRLRAWAAEYKRGAWADALLDLGVDDRALAAELAQLFERDRRARHVVFPESRRVLDELKKDYRLALLTNGASDIQRDKINGSELGHFFDTIIVSGEIGLGKPNPKLFRMALERLGTAPEESVMIGDSLRRDIAGARAVGIRTIWINRYRRTIPADYPTPDLELEDLVTLPTILTRAD